MVTTSHPSASLNKLTHLPYSWYPVSTSSSIMKKYGGCDPVKNLTQDPNRYYVSPKILDVSKLGHHSSYTVSLDDMDFFNGGIYYQVLSLIPSPFILIWKTHPVRKYRSSLNTRLLSNVTTPTSEVVGTTPSPYPPYTRPTGLQIHHGISTTNFLRDPIIHTTIIYFL